MSLKGKIGQWEFNWKTVPRGQSGVAQVEVEQTGGASGTVYLVEVRWRKDANGLWIELPSGVHGFDVQAESGDDGLLVYQLSERSGDGLWGGLSYLRAGEALVVAGGTGAKKGVRVRAQMPGKILRINVQAGAMVEKGQSILVMEAMKMENEIRAAASGKVGVIKVTEGQAVETGADLCVIEPA